MDAILRTPAEVIKALGGSTSAARRLGIQQTRVSNWVGRRNRIPPALILVVNAALNEVGKHAAPEVFGMVAPLHTNGARRKSPSIHR